MPREHDPEWMLRARLWAAAWKTAVLMVVGAVLTVGCYWRYGPMLGCFFASGLILFGSALIIWWRA